MLPFSVIIDKDIIFRVALSRAHTFAKAAHDVKLLALNKRQLTHYIIILILLSIVRINERKDK